MWFNILFEGAMQELRDLFPDASDNEPWLLHVGMLTELLSICLVQVPTIS